MLMTLYNVKSSGQDFSLNLLYDICYNRIGVNIISNFFESVFHNINVTPLSRPPPPLPPFQNNGN